MGNHNHIMAETPEATLSRGMSQLNGVYTLGFNRRQRRHGRVGIWRRGASRRSWWSESRISSS